MNGADDNVHPRLNRRFADRPPEKMIVVPVALSRFAVIDVGITETNNKVFVMLNPPAGKFDRPSGSFDLHSPPLLPQVSATLPVTDKTRPKWEAVTKNAKI
jgi:hypothetical protein